MQKEWVFPSMDDRLVEKLSKFLVVSTPLARLLVHRGIDSEQKAAEFLCADLSSLASPRLMEGLPRGVALIRGAIQRKEKIWIVGDYDVDGLTSTAVVYGVLRHLGAQISWHIPHRMKDGYGLRKEVVQKIADEQGKLLITVDCGTTHVEELALARRLGMETIVVDHHDLLPQGSPPASAFLNPLQPACRYPNKDLASVGVAFTLARGLLEEEPSFLWAQLDLVALGTVADVAPLTGENRILVKAGLHALTGAARKGLRALVATAQLQGRRVTSEDVSFYLAPRLNAMGRMGSAEQALRLLVTEDDAEAVELAKVLEKENKTRGGLEREALQKAILKVQREINFNVDRVVVLDDAQWHPGVVGIIAARVAARFHRPAVIIAGGGDLCRGSARSAHGLHLVEALEAVKEHLVEFGGHPAAAGFTIAREKIVPFRTALNQVVREKMQQVKMNPRLKVDAECPLVELTAALIRDLEMLAPFGAGNPQPVFVARDGRLPAESSKEAFDPKGIRVKIEDPRGRSFSVLQSRFDTFEGLNLRKLAGGVLHMAYSPSRSLNSSAAGIELRLRDVQIPLPA